MTKSGRKFIDGFHHLYTAPDNWNPQSLTGVSKGVRVLPASAALLLAGCGPGLEFNPSEMTPEQMLNRSSHVFVGVIKRQQIDSWPFLETTPDFGR